MQKQPDLALNLKNLFNPKSYIEFKQGDFINQPRMEGYYYIFHNISDPKFSLILNTSETAYPSTMSKVRDWVFIVFNVKSLEEYMENLGTYYFPQILDIIDRNLQKKNDRNLPYGYYFDENGKLQIDIIKSEEVKKIYKMYVDNPSVRTIAAKLKTNFSFIRDVLHDNEEYEQMEKKFLPSNLIKQVRDAMGANVKGTFKKETTEDEIEELRKRRKEMESKRMY